MNVMYGVFVITDLKSLNLSLPLVIWPPRYYGPISDHIHRVPLYHTICEILCLLRVDGSNLDDCYLVKH